MLLMEKLKKSGQVPNALTWLRIGLFWVPGAIIMANPHNTGYRWWSVVAFLLIVATDKLDGVLARRWQQITKLGQIIDPLADKLLVLSLVVALCAANILISPWGWLFLAINVARELYVTVLRWQRKHGEANLIVPANEDGKRKMFLQSVGVGMALLPIPFWWWQLIIWIPLAVSLFYSLRSGEAYLKAK